MEITEVRISRRTHGDAKLKGYAAVTFDDVFVVRDLKIIEGKKGLFVAMPSQKVYEPCPTCKKKNAVRSRFCNECGHKLQMDGKDYRESHRDIAHPVNSEMRAYLQKVIIEAYDHTRKGAPHSGDTAIHVEEDLEDIDSLDEYGNGNGARAPAAPTEDYLSIPQLNDLDRTSREDDSKQQLLDTID